MEVNFKVTEYNIASQELNIQIQLTFHIKEKFKALVENTY